MMQVWKIALVAGALSLVATSAHAGGAWLYEGAGTDVGVAGAGSEAWAGDATTAFSNPAGMSRLEGTQMVAGLQPFWVNASPELGPETTTPGGDGGNAGQGFSPIIPWGARIPLAGAYASYQLSDRWHLGFSFGSYAAAGLDYGDDWAGRYFVQKSGLVTLNANPVASFKVNDWLSVGAGFSIQYGKLQQTAAINNIADRLGDGKLSFSDANVGFGGNAGILLEPAAGTRIGITYRSQVAHGFEDENLFSGVGPVLRRALEQRGLYDARFRLDTTIPMQVAFGVSQDLMNDRLTLLASFNWQNWKQFGLPELSVQAAEAQSIEIDQQFEDTVHVAIGALYAIDETWTVSAGFGWDSAATSDEFRTFALPLDSQQRYAAGVKYAVSENLEAGLAYEFVNFGKAPVTQSSDLGGTVQAEFSPFHMQVLNFTLAWKS